MRKMLLITQSEISSGMDFIEKGLTEFEIGKKQYAIGVTKEQITFLTELEEDQLELPEEFGNVPGDTSFKEVMKSMLSNVKNRDDKK